jgi:hypothetical protein
MILNNTANHLKPSFASGHDDWFSRFTSIPQEDQDNENDEMGTIINLIAFPELAEEAKMATLINNEETTIFLALDAASKENFILLHNLEILPKTRHQKKPLIRALHGFGSSATVVTFDYDETTQHQTLNCASTTNIRKFQGIDKMNANTPRTAQSKLQSRAFIGLPPFIASKLMSLPDLEIDHVVATILKTITDYDRKKNLNADKTPINLTEEDEDNDDDDDDDDDKSKNDKSSDDDDQIGPKEKRFSSNPKTGEHLDDPIKDYDLVDDAEDEEEKEDEEEQVEPPIPKKKTPKHSSFGNCETLLRFIWLAAFQQSTLGLLSFGDKLAGVSVCVTSNKANLIWGEERHTRNSVGLVVTKNTTPTSASASASASSPNKSPEDMHLARKTTSALEQINATFADAFKVTKDIVASNSVDDKIHPRHLQMIRRLCTIDALTTRDPTDFFLELCKAKGKGGTGSGVQWWIQMRLDHRNLRATQGCISAIAQGQWCWDHAGYPNNLSIFNCPRTTANTYAKGLSDHTANLHLRANHGRDLSEKDIKLLTHQGMSYTPDIGETIKQLENFSYVLDILIHKDSMLATNFRNFIQYVKDHEEIYEANQSQDPLFCLKLLYKIDMIKNNFFMQCLSARVFGDVDWNQCDFYRVHSAVIDGNFNQLLPTNLGIPSSKEESSSSSATSSSKRGNKSKADDDSNDKDGSDNKKKKQKQSNNKDKIRQSEAKGDHVINTEQPPSLKLKPNESYVDTCMRTGLLAKMPKLPNSTASICGNYHITGHCHTACTRKDSHKALTPDLTSKIEAWLKQCRDKKESSE